MSGKPGGQQRHPWWRRHWLLKLTIVVCAVYLLFLADGSFFKLWRTNRKVEPQRSALQDLRAQSDSLQERNRLLAEGDSLELEKQAREWGMISEGDTIYHFRTNPEKAEKN